MIYFLGRADPDCALGHLLKALFRNDEFMDKLVNSYIMSTVEEFDLNCTAARVLLNAMPGLESAAVFQDMVSLELFSRLTVKSTLRDTSLNKPQFFLPLFSVKSSCIREYLMGVRLILVSLIQHSV